MLKLYSAGSLPEAYLLLHRLAQAGIEARVLNEHAQGGLGEIPFTHTYPEVWLYRSEDAERARAVVTEHERAAKAPLALRRCERCGEDSPESFDLCWRCGAVIAP